MTTRAREARPFLSYSRAFGQNIVASRQCDKFDHYCPYVGTTVGLQNYRWFYLYRVVQLAALQWECLAISYVKTYRRRGCFMGPWPGSCSLSFGFAMITYHTQLALSNLTMTST